VVVVSEDEGMIGVLICRDCGHSEWEDALQVCPPYEEIRGMRPTDVGWPQEFVDAHVVRHVRRDHLRQADTVKTVKGRS
jgi:hypothetical protein